MAASQSPKLFVKVRVLGGMPYKYEMSLYFQKLKFHVPFLIDESVVTTINKLTVFHSPDIISSDLLSLIKELGIKSTVAVVLFYPKHISDSNIHIDDIDVYDQTNLNFVIDYGSALSNWYCPLNGYEGNVSANIVTRTKSYDARHLTLVESTNTTGTCLFQGGVPHNVSNISNNRWCVSLKLRTNNNQPVNWRDAIMLFDKFIVK